MLSFIIPQDHLMRHFSGSGDVGSVFFAQSPQEVLAYAATSFPQVFIDATPDPKDGRKRLSFVADKNIGLCNVVQISDLTIEETKEITEEERDGHSVKTVRTKRTFPTREFHIILEEDNTVVTMFPGPMAPPLPQNGEESVFWNNHVFIKSC